MLVVGSWHIGHSFEKNIHICSIIELNSSYNSYRIQTLARKIDHIKRFAHVPPDRTVVYNTVLVTAGKDSSCYAVFFHLESHS